jgi:uncharacterized protein
MVDHQSSGDTVVRETESRNESETAAMSFVESRSALFWAGALLLLLWLAKTISTIPWFGQIALLGVAAMQLYLPIWRCDRHGLPEGAVGLSLGAWRRDIRLMAYLVIFTFPVYIVGHYVFLVHGRGLVEALGWQELGEWLPVYRWVPHLPASLPVWREAIWWFGELILTHTLGVALPEETFYRGYLLPQLQHWWRPLWRVMGVKVGWATVIASFLFALGHFIGEWNPLRLAPIFPALIFSWQRNATGSIVGAIGYHACCNILAEILATQYRQTL